MDPGYSDRFVYRVMKNLGLLRKRAPRRAELVHARRRIELLPTGSLRLLQTDVKYMIMDDGRWWYVVTVIDYYSRYLLACHLTPFRNDAVACKALDLAQAEMMRVRGACDEPITLVTDNGSEFTAYKFRKHLGERFTHVRIRCRTPRACQEFRVWH